MADDFATKARPALEALLEPGETLQGVVSATHQKTFSGSLYAVGITEHRLLLQQVDRKIQPKGPARVITPETLAKVGAGGGASDWYMSASAAIVDSAAIKLKLETTDGEKLTLNLMRGTGVVGSLGSDQGQQDGVAALAAWMRERAEGR